jgi:hypothetical protein
MFQVGGDVSNRPYTQLDLSDGRIVRTFEASAADHELEWHMDHHDRRVRVLEGEDWKLQLESGLPFGMRVDETYFIPKKSWHRVIKGAGNLKIEIEELRALSDYRAVETLT